MMIIIMMIIVITMTIVIIIVITGNHFRRISRNEMGGGEEGEIEKRYKRTAGV